MPSRSPFGVGVLSKRQFEVLDWMAKHRDCEDPECDCDSGELVYERGVSFIGLDRLAPRTFFRFLRLAAIRHVSGHPGGTERYVINETGLALLARNRPNFQS